MGRVRPGFFLPVRVLSRLFRRRFLDALQTAYETGTVRLEGSVEALRAPHAWAAALADLRQTEWVVYAKRPFAGPAQVLDYVGRYTHRVALSNNRLVDMDDGHVRFTYTDYRDPPPQTPKIMTLAAAEFIRRFLLHVLPTGLHRIRYYGWLGARHRREKLARCRVVLGTSPSAPPPPTASLDCRDRVEALTGQTLRTCPVCHGGEMRRVAELMPMPRAWPRRLDTS